MIQDLPDLWRKELALINASKFYHYLVAIMDLMTFEQFKDMDNGRDKAIDYMIELLENQKTNRPQ
jgi:hypothetical protein